MYTNMMEIVLPLPILLWKDLVSQTALLMGFKLFEGTHNLAFDVRQNLATVSVGRRREDGRQKWDAPIKWQHTKWHGASCQLLSIHPMSKGFAHLNESTHCQRSLRAEQMRAEKGRKAQEKWSERKRADFYPKFTVALILCSSILLVCPHLEYSFLGEFNNPLTSNCNTISQLYRLSWPHVLSEVNFE